MRYANENEKRMWDQLRKNNPYIYTKGEAFGYAFTMFLMGVFLGIIVGVMIHSAAYGSELRHSWKSPAFSGVGYSQHVLTIENLTFQRKQEIIAKKAAAQRELERELENTNINKFLRNFESRVYAELSKQLSEKLFGEAAENQGTIDIMGNTIDYNSDGTTLTMTVSELNGTTTKLEVPLSGFGF
jgi:hypothetical protein|tara:strand:+ start:938 stop:1492 length:555 start_codon:yes stop_codon:yes gene_type:complete